jgi:hypothetical protein
MSSFFIQHSVNFVIGLLLAILSSKIYDHLHYYDGNTQSQSYSRRYDTSNLQLNIYEYNKMSTLLYVGLFYIVICLGLEGMNWKYPANHGICLGGVMLLVYYIIIDWKYLDNNWQTMILTFILILMIMLLNFFHLK